MRSFSVRIALAGCLWMGLQAASHAADLPSSTGVFMSSGIADFDDLESPVQMVDDEFDPSLLENLPLPSSPPPHVSLPRAIMEKNQWRGSPSRAPPPPPVLLRQPASWPTLW